MIVSSCANIGEDSNIFLVHVNKQFVPPKYMRKEYNYQAESLSWTMIMVLLLSGLILCFSVIKLINRTYYDEGRSKKMLEILSNDTRIRANMVRYKLIFPYLN